MSGLLPVLFGPVQHHRMDNTFAGVATSPYHITHVLPLDHLRVMNDTTLQLGAVIVPLSSYDIY